MIYNQEDQMPQPDSIEHIFQVLNDVKAEELPVSDAVDTLAYWYHEAFQKGDIHVDAPEGNDLQFPPAAEDIWT